jgi:hypothetical protein
VGLAAWDAFIAPPLLPDIGFRYAAHRAWVSQPGLLSCLLRCRGSLGCAPMGPTTCSRPGRRWGTTVCGAEQRRVPVRTNRWGGEGRG